MGTSDTVELSNEEYKAMRQRVFVIAWPVFTELLLGALFGMVDMMMLGRIADNAEAAASVAAVGMTNQPLLVGLSLVQALNVGGTAMVARYFGAKQMDRMSQVLKHIMILAMVFFALPLSLLAYWTAPSILALMGAEPYVVAVGTPYFRIIMIGFLFQSFSFTMTAALRGIGQTKIPMVNNLIANFCNVLGNAVLIYGLFGFPKLGIVGAGISTATSNLIAASLNFRYILSGKSVLKIKLKEKFAWSKDIVVNLINVGLPSAGEQMVLRLGVILFLRIVSGLGTSVFAAHQIALNILSLSFSPGQAFGVTASTLVGQSLGAKQPHKAERYAQMNSRVGAIFSFLMAFVFYFGGHFIASIYSEDPEIIANTTTALAIIAVIQPFQAHQLILSGALRGAGDTVWPLVATFIGIICLRVSFGHLFVNVFHLGIAGAWYAVFVDQLIRWLIIFGRFKTGDWKHVQIR